ncbi:MAG TPA: hypothetical protein VMV27_09505 [Candidatus Binataceae bacterium]|nr:hypothetical protein [Candidatus Binataceae bacterium]
MKIHQELRIGPLDGDQEARFISWVGEHLTAGWSRDLALEEKLNRESAGEFYCFTCPQSPGRPAAMLFLTHPDRPATSWLYVPNIGPQEVQQLTLDQYNHILNEFGTRFAKPAADSIGVRVELSSPEQSIEDWLSPESAKLLMAFSHRANKSTGSSHPKDRERWCDFLIALHRAGESPNVDLLHRWLVEEEKWPDDVVFDLVCEYEFARDLLGRFDPR